MRSPALISTAPLFGVGQIFAQGMAFQRRVITGHLPDDAAVGRLNETILVNTGKGRQTADQTDVRTFRSLDRANTAIVRMVDIADIEPGAFTPQTSRTQSRERAFVPQLGEGVGLIHELGELAGAKKLTQRGHHRADIDQRHRRQLLLVTDGHALFNNPLHATQANAQLILDKFANRLDAAIAQVINIIRRFDAIVNQDHSPQQVE